MESRYVAILEAIEEPYSPHYLFNISDVKINELEIPTGNPLVVEFGHNLKIEKYYYLVKSRAKDIIFNQ